MGASYDLPRRRRDPVFLSEGPWHSSDRTDECRGPSLRLAPGVTSWARKVLSLRDSGSSVWCLASTGTPTGHPSPLRRVRITDVLRGHRRFLEVRVVVLLPGVTSVPKVYPSPPPFVRPSPLTNRHRDWGEEDYLTPPDPDGPQWVSPESEDGRVLHLSRVSDLGLRASVTGAGPPVRCHAKGSLRCPVDLLPSNPASREQSP